MRATFWAAAFGCACWILAIAQDHSTPQLAMAQLSSLVGADWFRGNVWLFVLATLPIAALAGVVGMWMLLIALLLMSAVFVVPFTLLGGRRFVNATPRPQKPWRNAEEAGITDDLDRYAGFNGRAWFLFFLGVLIVVLFVGKPNDDPAPGDERAWLPGAIFTILDQINKNDWSGAALTMGIVTLISASMIGVLILFTRTFVGMERRRSGTMRTISGIGNVAYLLMIVGLIVAAIWKFAGH